MIEVERPIVRVADGPSLSSVALAALIVSIVAGIVAALSALYARRVAVVEEERRVDETRPRFDSEHDGDLGGDERVLITYTGPEEALDSIRLIVRSTAPSDAFGLYDVGAGATAVGEVTVGTVLLGQTVPVKITRLSDDSHGTLRLEAQCQRHKRRWSVLIECEIPGIPRIHGF